MLYSVAIRTLGTAGDKYQRLLDSLDRQTLPPQKIVVYIADGYPIPSETIGKECYVYVKKGMVAQRALRYEEIETEYVLFLDDDLELQDDTVEKMFDALISNNLDVLAPDIYDNARRPFHNEVMMFLSGRMRPRLFQDNWGYKVMRTAGYSYRKDLHQPVYLSQTNAGAAFLCKKDHFLQIKFEEESWLDDVPYALGDDQAMFYKMYKVGLTIGTWYNHSFVHLDGGNHMTRQKERTLIFNDLRFKIIFWHRFIFLPSKRMIERLFNIGCIAYMIISTLVLSLFKFQFEIMKLKYRAIFTSIKYINSPQYKALPRLM